MRCQWDTIDVEAEVYFKFYWCRLAIFLPVPNWGRGIVFDRFLCLFVCLFVSLSASLRENGLTDLHEIFREGVD